MKKSLVMAGMLFAFWLFLTFSLDVASILAGLVVVLAVLWFNRKLILTEAEMDFYTLAGIGRFLRFLGVLIYEIILANLQVAKIVLDPKMPIQPSFFHYPMKLKKPMHQVLYANAITLTPGTLTVDVIADGFIIHALTDEAKAGLPGSRLERFAHRLEDPRD